MTSRLLDIRVQLAILANRQTRLDNPLLEARINRIKLALDTATLREEEPHAGNSAAELDLVGLHSLRQLGASKLLT